MNVGETGTSPKMYLDHGAYRSEPHPEHKDKEKDSMEGCVMFRVQNGEQDQASVSNRRAEDGERREDFLPHAHVGRESVPKRSLAWYAQQQWNSKSVPPLVPQPPFHYEGDDESNCCDTAANNKKRLEDICPNVGDIDDRPVHGDILGSPLGEPSDEHCE